ncbi:hypothetical protein B0H10DRAFT_57678 [Mycena sp. CBHHK59/15]|nr:hypothetical protein B0H10DRAFT_57678 [Mycena sp. CBHHK59/15]
MSMHLSALAWSSTMTSPFHKGSRDYFRLRHLSRFAVASSLSLHSRNPRSATQWRDYDSTGSSLIKGGESAGWREYRISLDNPHTPTPQSFSTSQPFSCARCTTLHHRVGVTNTTDNLLIRRPNAPLQLDHHTQPLAAGSASPTNPSTLSLPAELGSCNSPSCPSYGYHTAPVRAAVRHYIEDTDAHRQSSYEPHSSPGKVERMVREQWKKSGLRVSPFRLRGLGRLE